MKDVDAEPVQVPRQSESVAGRSGTLQHRLDRGGGLFATAAAVGREADPPALGAMAAKRSGKAFRAARCRARPSSGQSDRYAAGRDEAAAARGQDFQRVQPPPVLPVEPVGTAVCRRHEVAPALARVGVRLTDCLHARTVQCQEECGWRSTDTDRLRGSLGVVLHAAIDAAAEGPLASLPQGADAECKGQAPESGAGRRDPGADAALEGLLPWAPDPPAGRRPSAC